MAGIRVKNVPFVVTRVAPASRAAVRAAISTCGPKARIGSVAVAAFARNARIAATPSPVRPPKDTTTALTPARAAASRASESPTICTAYPAAASVPSMRVPTIRSSVRATIVAVTVAVSLTLSLPLLCRVSRARARLS